MRQKGCVVQRESKWYAVTEENEEYGPFADRAEAWAVLHPHAAMWGFALLWAFILSVAFLLFGVVTFGQSTMPTAPPETVATVVPASISSITPVQGSLAQVLLSKYPLPANLILNNVLASFMFNLNVNGLTYNCSSNGALPDGSVVLSCTVLTAVPPPNSGSPAATPPPAPVIARVNQGVWGGLTPQNEALTQPLGWTVTQGGFLAVAVGGGTAGSGVTGVTAYAGTTAYPMLQAVVFNSGRTALHLYYLPNAPAVTSLTLSFYESDASTFTVSAAEYSGLSTTAAPVATAYAVDSGYNNTSTWTAGPYTVPAGALVLSGTASNYGTGAWVPGTGWTVIGSYSAGTTPGFLWQEQIAPPAGAITATGTFVQQYQYFDSFIVAFK